MHNNQQSYLQKNRAVALMHNNQRSRTAQEKKQEVPAC